MKKIGIYCIGIFLFLIAGMGILHAGNVFDFLFLDDIGNFSWKNKARDLFTDELKPIPGYSTRGGGRISWKNGAF